MSNVFLKIHPLDRNNKPIKTHCFDMENNMFVKVNQRATKNIPNKKYFTRDEKIGKFKVLRARNEFKETLMEEFQRDHRNLKRRKIETHLLFSDKTVLVLSQPHKYIYKSQRPIKHKFAFDVLNNEFILISNETWKNEGLHKFGRGFLVRKENGKWKKIMPISEGKFTKELDEIQLQGIHDIVGENLLLWISKSKYDNMCNRCKKTCKQPKLTELMFCKTFDAIKSRKKRAVK